MSVNGDCIEGISIKIMIQVNKDELQWQPCYLRDTTQRCKKQQQYFNQNLEPNINL